MVWRRDPRLKELVETFGRMAERVKRPYAVGGALAMEVYGYRRYTTDLDVFARLEDRQKWLRAAVQEGLTVSEVFNDVHYIAVDPRHNDLDVRIDLLFPATDPELSAIEEPIHGHLDDQPLAVFPIVLLAASKVLSDRIEDVHDFVALLRRGLVEPEAVRIVVGLVEPEHLEAYDRLVADVGRPPRPRTRRPLPRKR